jgi:streptogramin lyase
MQAGTRRLAMCWLAGIIGSALVLASCGSGGTGTNPASGSVQPTERQSGPIPAPTNGPASSAGLEAGSASPAGPSAKVTATITIPGNPGGMIEGFGSVWVVSRHGDFVDRIDPATSRITASIAIPAEPAYLVNDGAAIWVTEAAVARIARIDPATDAVTATALPGHPYLWPSAGAGAVWQNTDAGVARIDSTTHAVTGTVASGSVAFAHNLVWVSADNGVQRFNPTTLKLKDIVAPDVAVGEGMMAGDESQVWAGSGDQVWQLDPKTGRVIASYPLPPAVDGGMSVLSGGRLWLQQTFPEAFSVVDTQAGTLAPLQLLPHDVTNSLFFLSLGPHDLWVSDWDADVIYRVDPG